MSSSNLCSQCLRALRHTIRAGSRTTSRRNFSSSLQRFEEQAAAGRSSHRSNPVPFVPPTTASTATTNATPSDPPGLQPRSQSPPQNAPSQDATSNVVSTASVSQMQKQIVSGLRNDNLTTRLAKGLRKTAKSTTESYIIYGETEAIFKACASQADYTIPEDQRMSILTGKGPPQTADGADLGQAVGKSWWYDTIGLEPTFATWSQVTYLHMYIITLRLRNLETADACRDYQRYLTEHFSHAAEDKMVLLHNMSARSIRNKYLKDLFLQWRGILTAYDEGIIKGDAVLGAAIWRNLFRGDENVDWEKVARVVAFLRIGIQTFGTQRLHDIVMNSDGPKGLWAQTHQ